VNLVIVGGNVDVKQSKDNEEIEQIDRMHELIKEYNLDGNLRWICAQKNRVRNGERSRSWVQRGRKSALGGNISFFCVQGVAQRWRDLC
jgi:ribosomal protein L15E